MTDNDDLKNRILEYEDLMTEINKRRNPSSKKSWWEGPGVIPALTAVLTVALTSAAAFYTQRSMREEDFLTSQSKATYENAVGVVNTAHSLADQTMYWAGERERLLWGDYRTRLDSGDKRLVQDSVNASDTKWRGSRGTQRVGIALSFGDDPVILNAWDSTVVNVNAYTTCTVRTGGCDSLWVPAQRAIATFRDSSVARLNASRPSVVRK